MAAFPKLRTGAVAQYPIVSQQEYKVAVSTYLDGSEQRYRSSGRPVRRWVLELSQLDAAEAAQVREFFRQQRGRAGTFAFQDPVSGMEYQRCCFEQDELPLTHLGENSIRARLVIRALEA